uniref:Uncharacterized protein n=2 Tax=Gouania willdenowi TaxID=441366 RepID=A0A8C5FYF1_GOUWI
MVASTITLHLVQCRAVGRSLSSFGFKSALTLNSSGAGFLKRQSPSQASGYVKKMRLNKEPKGATSAKNAESEEFALDPRSYEHNTYEARKNFLTAYFNRRPYISTQEEESLSTSLWLWKSDISKHFESKRKLCVSSCKDKKTQVLLGFDMQALKKVQHDINFIESNVDPLTRKVGRLKSGFTISEKTKMSKTQTPLTSTFSECTETISIDSDNEPEPDQPTENGDINTNHVKDAQSEEAVNLTEESVEEITEISEETAKEKEISPKNEKTDDCENH